MAVGALQERRIAVTGEVCNRIFVHAFVQKRRDEEMPERVQVIGFRQTDFREQGFQVLAERVRMDGRAVVFCENVFREWDVILIAESHFAVAEPAQQAEHMYFFTGFKIDAVDDTVRVNVFAVNVRADQNFTALKISSKSACCFMCCARVDVCTFWKTLYHVVKHHAAVFVVQQLRAQKFVECRFRLAANAADELLTIPERLAELGNIAHDTFHTPARLRPLPAFPAERY